MDMAFFAIELGVPPSEYHQLTMFERDAFVDTYNQQQRRKR